MITEEFGRYITMKTYHKDNKTENETVLFIQLLYGPADQQFPMETNLVH